MSRSPSSQKTKRISSAADNMCALVDDMVKKARKSFKATGSPELDARFLKESVSALRELVALQDDCDGTNTINEGVIIRLEKEIEEWTK